MRALKDVLLAALFFWGLFAGLIFLSVILSGCGTYEVEVVQREPLVVKHEISLDGLRAYFIEQCYLENPYYTPHQAEICAQAKISDLLSRL